MACGHNINCHRVCTLGWVLEGLVFLMALSNFNQYAASALTQSHQGSASTSEFMLNGTSPGARIKISSSSTIYVVKVDPPKLFAVTGSEELKWKVSLELLAMQLCDPADAFSGDRLKVVYSDTTTIKSTTWKLNASYSSQVDKDGDENRELKNIQANQIVLIPEGRWILSGADLVATLYQEPSLDGTCPENTFPCSCTINDLTNSLEEASLESHVQVTRCISKSLVCNGHPNCGLGCRDDESETFCSGSSSSYTDTISSCVPPENLSTTTLKTEPANSGGVGKTCSKTTATFVGVNVIIMIFMSRILL